MPNGSISNVIEIWCRNRIH